MVLQDHPLHPQLGFRTFSGAKTSQSVFVVVDKITNQRRCRVVFGTPSRSSLASPISHRVSFRNSFIPSRISLASLIARLLCIPPLGLHLLSRLADRFSHFSDSSQGIINAALTSSSKTRGRFSFGGCWRRWRNHTSR
jgi:hypothetical protein